MKEIFILLVIFTNGLLLAQKKNQSNENFAIVIHGGAGTILKKNLTDELEKEYKDKIAQAMQAGYDTLKNGGRSMDAVVAAIKILEDSPLFNAGKGSVFTADGKNEMDAAIMDGNTLKAGAVAGVRTIKNPITAALCVLEKSQHVMMVGSGAEKFAKTCSCELQTLLIFLSKNAGINYRK